MRQCTSRSVLGVCGAVCVLACSDEPADVAPNAIDLTDVVLSNMSANCADYAETYFSDVMDIKRDLAFIGSLSITTGSGSCSFETNSIPNHDFNDASAKFATDVAEVVARFTITSNPVAAAKPTEIGLAYDNAIFLNGVKLDLLAAACYGIGGGPLGEEKIGCNDASTPWRYDPLFLGNDFGTDAHNAHTQPDGTYHYHGDPDALYSTTDTSVASPVIGFAADGFPIFGPYFDDNGTVRKAVSGYTLKAGIRESQSGEGAFPGGTYNGMFRDDYAFTDAGDLDECNGMTVDGVYGYYLTDSFPWVLNCFTGSPDSSFRKGAP